MTAEEMKAYIGTPQFVPLEPNYFSCIDGRHDKEVIATPGGDMGLFLSAAEIHIKSSSSPSDYSESRLEHLLRDFIRKFRSPTDQFYMHTDEHAVHRVHERLVEERVDKGVNMSDLVSASFDPPAAAKAVLLEALSDMAVGVGCGHIKNMVPPKLHPLQLLAPLAPLSSRLKLLHKRIAIGRRILAFLAVGLTIGKRPNRPNRPDRPAVQWAGPVPGGASFNH
jgi:hypothetical protein